ncbi:hypothetical protein UM181_01725 [Alphaproteobacteria bacterium US3C007]|nr:hypothetical protein UM181_01725 [Alphaproteobacteria bacterium US3C007]
MAFFDIYLHPKCSLARINHPQETLSVFIMIREAELTANQTPISCKGQELVFFQKMAIAQPVVIFQACCFAEKNSPYT